MIVDKFGVPASPNLATVSARTIVIGQPAQPMLILR